MLLKNPEQWARIDKFLMSFSPNEKIAIIHDADPDGLCAAVILSRMIEKLRGKPADFLYSSRNFMRNSVAPNILKMLKSKKISKVIFADLPVHEDATSVRRLEKQCEALIIDHHMFFHDVTSSRTVLAMPQLLADDIDPSRYPASKLAYDLANRHVDTEDSAWIAAVGLIGDLAGSAWPEFLAQVFERQNLKPNPKDWFKTDLGMVSELLLSAMIIDDKNINYCYDALMKAKAPADILKNRMLVLLRKSLEKEVSKWASSAPRLMQKDDKLKMIWYEITPKYPINSPLSTMLSLKPKYSDYTIILVDKGRDIVRVSGRCRSQRVKMNELLKNAVRGFKDAVGGGHIPAAGAHFRPADLQKFKQRIVDALGKNLYTNKENKTQQRGE
ncbi:MAG: DHHA1 domain-containing protein [Candidatus Woesearchaeota archaeon]